MKRSIALGLGLAFVCVQAAWSDTYQWNSVAMGGGGFVTGILTSPTQKNVIYARTDVGGAYRWNEAGQSWIPMTDWASVQQTSLLGVESFATDPQNPSKVFLSLGTSYFDGGLTVIARSHDYGASFEYTDVTSQFKVMGNGSNRHTGEKLGVDPNSSAVLFCGTRSNGLFKSIDSGVTWQAVASLPVSTTTNGNGISFVQFDKSSGTVGKPTPRIFVGVQTTGATNFYVSQNGGSTWSAVAGAPTNYMPERASLASDGKMFISYGDVKDSAGAVYKFDTKAASNAWTNITPASMTGRAFGGVSVDASNPQRVLVSTFSQWMYQTWDGTTSSWGDHILLSTNGGTAWTDLITTGNYTFDTNGFPWVMNHALHWAGCAQIDPFNPSRAFVISGNGLFSTTNLGSAPTHWKFTVAGLEETVPYNFISLPKGPFFDVIGDYDGIISSDITKSPASGVHNPNLGSNVGLAFGWKLPTTIARAAGTKIY